jgi:predicted Zn-ribbon and HTH transcriptional regulator
MIRIGRTTARKINQEDEEDEARPDVEAARAEGRVNRVECRTCGYEPLDQSVRPQYRCPKCHSTTWVNFVRSDLIRSAGCRWDQGRFSAVRGRSAVRCLLPTG